MFKPFNQPPPTLGNQYLEDRVVRSYLKRIMPSDSLQEMEPSLIEMGELSGGSLYELQLQDRLNEPELTRWDAWGERIDQVDVSPLWKKAESIAARMGLVAAGFEKKYGALSRPYQFALTYLFHASSDVYTCPLAMTDGAVRTLLHSKNQELIDYAIPHLTSRDPKQFWTSGQWMTESTGGSDVGTTETIAKQDEDGNWRLWGRKWFTSAVTSQMTLTLARPEGNPAGGKGLALFFLETHQKDGRLNHILVNRLKDKLGTRKVPTAELTLQGSIATPVVGLNHGIRHIIPMLQVTRTWNSITAVSAMRRGMALARDYARKRRAFGAPLSEKPLHVDTLAYLQAESEAGFHLAFFLTELLGRDEAGEIQEQDAILLRILTSVVKLTTARQAVHVTSEAIESFGGAGYVEDTGLPILLRDSQVFPIWEGTTNVLSLDTLRALGEGDALRALQSKIHQCTQSASDPSLVSAGMVARRAIEHAGVWLGASYQKGKHCIEAGARRFAMTLGRSLALALLVEHAQWSIEHEQDGRARAAAVHFAATSIDQIGSYELEESSALANDEPLPVG